MKNKMSRFFDNKKVNSIFAVLLISITIFTFFFEENRVAKKEYDLLNFDLKSGKRPNKGSKDFSVVEFDQKIRVFRDYRNEPYGLCFIWNESDDDKLIEMWYDFNDKVKEIGMLNIDESSYKERIRWFDHLIMIRKLCIPAFLNDRKEHGSVLDAIEYGVFKGILTNFMFYDIEERSTTLNSFGPGMVNDYYCYSTENRQINILTSFMFGIGLLFPWYLVLLYLLRKK
jgi:hypothetical protein